jgi:NAD(P)-dependent dehydrogenase (short-subunit alcohol dehydrogenase family)
VKATVDATDRLDYLVNVACTYLDNGADTARVDWLKAFDVNVVGSVMLDAGGAAAPEKEQRRHRQFRLDLLARGTDRPLGSIRYRRQPSCN